MFKKEKRNDGNEHCALVGLVFYSITSSLEGCNERTRTANYFILMLASLAIGPLLPECCSSVRDNSNEICIIYGCTWFAVKKNCRLRFD